MRGVCFMSPGTLNTGWEVFLLRFISRGSPSPPPAHTLYAVDHHLKGQLKHSILYYTILYYNILHYSKLHHTILCGEALCVFRCPRCGRIGPCGYLICLNCSAIVLFQYIQTWSCLQPKSRGFDREASPVPIGG